jgi:hypothetical protein
LFKKYFPAMASGNNVLTVVTFEITGNSNIQRFVGVGIDNARGAGLGDLNHDGAFTASDMTGPGSFEQFLYSQNTTFDPAADINADGLVDNHDLFVIRAELLAAGVGQSVLDEQRQVLLKRGDFNNSGTTDHLDLEALYSSFGSASWLFDLDVDGQVNAADVVTFLTKILSPTPGDFNIDGFVDSTDFVLWQNRNGPPAEYESWRTHFGQPVAPGTATAPSWQNAVPEPAGAWLLIIGAATWYLRQRALRVSSARWPKSL